MIKVWFMHYREKFPSKNSNTTKVMLEPIMFQNSLKNPGWNPFDPRDLSFSMLKVANLISSGEKEFPKMWYHV